MPAPRPLTVAAAANALRARGLRVSAARRRMLAALCAADRPMSAEELAGGDEPIASVYRNLEALERAGLVHRVQLGHGPGVYTLGDRRYVLCDRCGSTRTLAAGEADALRHALADACGYEAQFPLVGSCPACLVRTARDEF